MKTTYDSGVKRPKTEKFDLQKEYREMMQTLDIDSWENKRIKRPNEGAPEQSRVVYRDAESGELVNMEALQAAVVTAALDRAARNRADAAQQQQQAGNSKDKDKEEDKEKAGQP